MGLFKPKWKSVKAEDRLNWTKKANVLKAKHVNILKYLAQTDKERSVRVAAIKKINDQEFLIEEVKHHWDSEIKLAALQKIEDKNVVQHIAKSSRNFEARQLAYKLLEIENCQQAVYDRVKNSYGLISKSEALKLLTEQKYLEEIVLSNIDSSIRIKAMDKLKNRNILNDIAQNDKYYEVRKKAHHILGLENDQAFLLDTVKNDSVLSTKLNALSKISSEEELLKIALFDPLTEIKEVAVAGIKDEEKLVSVVKSGIDLMLRKKVLQRIKSAIVLEKLITTLELELQKVILPKIDNQSIIKEFALNHENQEIRIIALEKLQDRKTINKIAREDGVFHIRQLAFLKLGDKLSQDALYDLIMHESNTERQKVVLAKITDEVKLEKLAFFSPSVDIQLAATKKIESEHRLSNIVQTHSNEKIKKSALKKISNQNYLEYFITHLDIRWIKEFAMNKITNPNNLFNISFANIDLELRLLAVEKIDDEQFLKKIVKKSKETSITITALKKVKSNEFLFAFINYNENSNLRRAALHNITDKRILNLIANNEKDESLKLTAILKIKGPRYLIELFNQQDNYNEKIKLFTVLISFSSEYEEVMKFVRDTIKELSVTLKNRKAELALRKSAGNFMKEIYKNEFLDAENRQMILQINGSLLKTHSDRKISNRSPHTDRYNHNHSDNSDCGFSLPHYDSGRHTDSGGHSDYHDDSPAIRFDLNN
jgi:hypothetical protein